MARRRSLYALMFALLALTTATAQDHTVASIDKQQLESYIRYAEAFKKEVHVSIDDPTPSVFPNFSRLVVHVSLGDKQAFDKVYYVTKDGREIVDGKLWDTQQSPFAAMLRQLPTDGPAFGPANAKIMIVVFSDFQCPYCRELARTVRQNIAQLYPNDVRVVFADYPLEAIHPWAYPMAEAAHCVANGSDATFWTFHDWVYQHQQEINKENLKEKVMGYAKEHNLETPAIESCMDTHATADTVKHDQQIGRLLQVDQTPTLFINGRIMPGAQPWEHIDAVIKLELARARTLNAN